METIDKTREKKIRQYILKVRSAVHPFPEKRKWNKNRNKKILIKVSASVTNNSFQSSRWDYLFSLPKSDFMFFVCRTEGIHIKHASACIIWKICSTILTKKIG